MTRERAAQLIAKLGPRAAKLYIRSYFANERLPVEPESRRMEFARFFFPALLEDDPPEFHLELFRDFSSSINSADAAPRGHAKTTILGIEILYRIVHGINHYIVPISDTYTQAKDQVDNVRSELESNEELRWIYGDLTTSWHWTSGAFTTANEVRVVARGSNMKVRGLKYKQWRPDFVPIDDLENDEAVMKPERREKLMNWLKRAVFPAMAARNSKIAMVGTVLHEDSLLNNALKGEKGFGGWLRQRFAALNSNPDGTEYSLWPGRFPVDHLKRMRDDPTYERYLGPLAFSQEMQNQAIDDAARIIRRQWIYGTDDKPLPYSLEQKQREWEATHPPGSRTWLQENIVRVIMAVDPAISEKTTADFFAVVVVGFDKNGEIWILDVFQDRIGEIDRQIDVSLEMAYRWGELMGRTIDGLIVESVAYQAGLARAIRRKAAESSKHLPVREVKPDKDKFRRAVVHSSNFAGQLVHCRKDHPLFDAFVQQLLDFPVGEHDDMFDAFMHACESTVMRQQTRTFSTKPSGF